MDKINLDQLLKVSYHMSWIFLFSQFFCRFDLDIVKFCFIYPILFNSKQMDPSARMENDVREVLTEFVDDYVNQLLKKTCELAKYRGSDNVEVKDVQV